MTVTQSHVVTASSPSSVLLAKHWGPERLVEILREPNCSLGISIVGGKVRYNYKSFGRKHVASSLLVAVSNFQTVNGL
jgi:hypothetical protein